MLFYDRGLLLRKHTVYTCTNAHVAHTHTPAQTDRDRRTECVWNRVLRAVKGRGLGDQRRMARLFGAGNQWDCCEGCKHQ